MARGGSTEDLSRFDDCTPAVIAACIEVHRAVGPGLLESIYEECLAHELDLRGIRFQRQVHVPVEYKGVALASGHRLDLLIESTLVLELKAVERLLPLHEAQVITYLRLLGLRTGLIVNFNVPAIKYGLRRLTVGSGSRALAK